jgi:hypothetical protein
LVQLEPGGAGKHPRLSRSLILGGGKIEDPVLVHELVAEIKGNPFQSRQDLVVIVDAVGPHQHEQVGPVGLRVCPGNHPGGLPVDQAFHLSANCAGPGQGLVLRVKDQAVGATLDVDGLAVLSPPALVRDQGIRLVILLPEQLDVLESLFQAVQLLGQLEQVLARPLLLLFLLVHLVFSCLQVCESFQKAEVLGPHPAFEVLHALLAGLIGCQAGSGFFLDPFDPAAEQGVLLQKQCVQGLALSFPLGLARRVGAGRLRRLIGRGAGRGACGFPECLGPARSLGLPVDDQQQQNQRSHGAEQDGQKGKGRNLKPLPPAPHNSS